MFGYILAALVLIFLDKLITAMTILKVEKNYPNKDKFSVEKNPLAHYFFRNFGLTLGTVFYFILSFFSFFFSVWLLDFIFEYRTGFILVSIVYFLVIINNIKWYFKFSKKC